MEINIIVEDEFKKKVTKRRLKGIVKSVLTAEKQGNKIELGVMITSQEKIHELNRTYRNVDRPTDVLSFFMIPETESANTGLFVTPPDNIAHLGEVIISYPQAVVQAKENKHPVSEEIKILLVHGVLHLLGYDHEKPEDEERMKPREEAVLKSIKEQSE
jgi:probable rRNA maturation factor